MVLGVEYDEVAPLLPPQAKGMGVGMVGAQAQAPLTGLLACILPPHAARGAQSHDCWGTALWLP